MLIVDDDPEVLVGMRNRLHAKYKLATASGADEALDRLADDAGIAVIISDLRMPGKDGLALLSKVREDYPSVVRILLSGNADVTTAARAINGCGIFKLLLKPSPPGEIEQAVDSALVQREREAEASSLALEDFLLGIGNRRALEQSLSRNHGLATRHRRPYGLAMIDVDHFKHYNDACGHLAGDHVLASVAQAIRSTIRSSDEAFRYGGDEIVIIFPDTEADGLRIACERCRQRVERLRLPHQDNSPDYVTVSIGASYHDGISTGRPDELLHQADLALYQSKAAGRNHVTLWRP